MFGGIRGGKPQGWHPACCTPCEAFQIEMRRRRRLDKWEQPGEGAGS